MEHINLVQLEIINVEINAYNAIHHVVLVQEANQINVLLVLDNFICPEIFVLLMFNAQQILSRQMVQIALILANNVTLLAAHVMEQHQIIVYLAVAISI